MVTSVIRPQQVSWWPVVIATTKNGGGLPYGTVVFVEGYGLGVIGDCGNFGSNMLDLCLDAGEISQGVRLPQAAATFI